MRRLSGEDSSVERNSLSSRRNALRKQLLVAGHYKGRGLITQACAQLVRTVERIDSDYIPDTNDYITGDDASMLAEQVTSLRTDWKCK